MDAPAVERLTDLILQLEPTVILTHAAKDPFNPDHAVAHEATVQARQLASGAGVASAFETIAPPELLLFEPHQPELCGFVPTTFLDITPVWEKKVAAMEAMGAQSYLRQYYTERAEHRANHARRISRSRPTSAMPRRSSASSRSSSTRCDRLRRDREARRRDDPRGRRPHRCRRPPPDAGRTGLPGRGPGPHRRLRAGRQLDGARGRRSRRAGGRARADERRARAGRARRRAARDAGTGERRRGDPRRRCRTRPRRARRDRPPDLDEMGARVGCDEGRGGRARRPRSSSAVRRSGPAISS